nr:spry domain protein [uncultured Mediterranean phage uvMED]
MPLILGTNSIKDTGYNVANSCRFNVASTDYLNISQSNGNRKTYTWSCWFKRSTLATFQLLWHCNNAGHYSYFGFNGDDKLVYYAMDGATNQGDFRSTRVFRDVSAWYHIVARIDTTESSSGDRLRFYINGEQITSWESSSQPMSQNTDTEMNVSGHTFRISTYNNSSSWLGGYLAECVFIDSQSLPPTSFGEFDSESPTIWKPIDVSDLTFGTNGFYLDFEDSSALGNDANGSNNFTVNNLTAIDQSTDTCTNNFATLNSLIDKGITYSEGNLQYKNTHGSNSEFTLATIQEVSNGRWYWEIKMASTNNNSAYEYFGNGTAYVKSNGDIYPSGTTTVSNGNIFGFYLNYEDGQMTIHRNGSQVYQSSSGISLSTTTAQIAAFNNTEYQVNFGNPIFSISSGNADANGYGNFEYSPALSGVNFYSLNTKNLAEFG